MKKRTIVTVLFVVGLLIAAFIGVNVLAQGEVTDSSSPDGPVYAPAYSLEESAPGSNVQDDASVSDSSSSSGETISAVGSPVEERAPGSMIQTDITVWESSIFTGVISATPGTPIEETVPVMSMQNATGGPSSPAWNSNIRYAGSTLRPSTNDVNYSSGDKGCIYATGGDTTTVWNIPLTLPASAQVEYLRMYFYDANTSNNINGWFTKYDLFGNLIAEWAVASFDSPSPYYNYSDVQITPTETIDYDYFSYVLNYRPNAIGFDLKLCGFRIFYTVFGKNFLPFISK